MIVKSKDIRENKYGNIFPKENTEQVGQKMKRNFVVRIKQSNRRKNFTISPYTVIHADL